MPAQATTMLVRGRGLIAVFRGKNVKNRCLKFALGTISERLRQTDEQVDG